MDSMKLILLFFLSAAIILITLYNISNQRTLPSLLTNNFRIFNRVQKINNQTYQQLTENTYEKQSNLRFMTNEKYLLDKNYYDRMGWFFPGRNDSLETTVTCIGSLRNQSCLYKNLYYVNGTFTMLTLKGRHLGNLSVRTDTFETRITVPRHQEFNSYPELEQFVRYSIDPIVLPGVTLYFRFPWLGNIGHSLFDALYPAYVALIRFPPRHLQPFRLLSEIDHCPGCQDEDIFNRFSGIGILKYYILADMSIGTWFVFDELVMGSGLFCQRCTQPNLQLPGGVELDGSRLFRDRMYAQHGVFPPTRRFVHSAERRNPNTVLRGYIMENKRYSSIEVNEIKNAVNEINNYTLKHQNLTDLTKLEWPLMNISYLHYGNMRDVYMKPSRFNQTSVDARRPTYELKGNFFSGQLRWMRTMDIHIVGPGTGQMYQTFLPDGSVVINLGGLQVKDSIYGNVTYTTYLEQYMTSGAPYLRGLYYPINERPKGIQKDQVVKLIRQAGKLIMSGFSIPVNPKENLAPDGLLFIEMCEKDKTFCELVTARAPNTPFDCYHFWVDEVIHERRMWRRGTGNDGNTNAKCPFNRTLMYELRDKYGIYHNNSLVN